MKANTIVEIDIMGEINIQNGHSSIIEQIIKVLKERDPDIVELSEEANREGNQRPGIEPLILEKITEIKIIC